MFISLRERGATRRQVVGVIVFMCLSCAAVAQQRDPAGTSDILREDQQRRLAPPLPREAPLETPPKRAVKPVAGLKVDVTGYRFSGLTIVRPEALQGVVEKYIGTDKTFEDLQAAADAVSEYLQQQGYFVAQAYLPEQKIADGTVEIAVLEGRLGRVRVDTDPQVRVRRELIEHLLSPLQPGTVLHRDAVERGLFLVSDLRGLNVRSIVEPGSAPGTSDLVLKIEPGRAVDGTIEFDNHGSRFTGELRLGGSLNINSPFGNGDLLSFRGLLGVPGGGKDLDFGRVSYLTPVGNYGTKLGASYLRLNYHLGTSSFEALDAAGYSEVMSLFGLHPIIRTRNFNLFVQGNFDFREFQDRSDAFGLVSDRETRVGAIGIVGDSRDTHLGGGINNFSLTYTRGHLDIQGANELAADQAAGTGRFTAGGYARYNATISRLNALTQDMVLFGSYSFQLASKNLDASEKQGLGGPYAVRAYGVGEATADESHLLTAELRFGLPPVPNVPGNVQATLFYDFAYAKLNKDPRPLDGENTRTLQGVGLGLTWSRPDDFLVRASLAWRTSGHPTSDPADRVPRLYFQLIKYL